MMRPQLKRTDAEAGVSAVAAPRGSVLRRPKGTLSSAVDPFPHLDDAALREEARRLIHKSTLVWAGTMAGLMLFAAVVGAFFLGTIGTAVGGCLSLAVTIFDLDQHLPWIKKAREKYQRYLDALEGRAQRRKEKALDEGVQQETIAVRLRELQERLPAAAEALANAGRIPASDMRERAIEEAKAEFDAISDEMKKLQVEPVRPPEKQQVSSRPVPPPR